MDALFSIQHLSFDISHIIDVPLAYDRRAMLIKARQVVDAGDSERTKFENQMRLAADTIYLETIRRPSEWVSVPERANPPTRASDFLWLTCCAAYYDRITDNHRNGGLTDDLFSGGSRAMELGNILFGRLNPGFNDCWRDLVWATAGIRNLRSLCTQSQFDITLPKIISSMEYARFVQAGKKIGLTIPGNPFGKHSLMVDIPAPHGGTLVMEHRKTMVGYFIDSTSYPLTPYFPRIDVKELCGIVTAMSDRGQALALVRAVNNLHDTIANEDQMRVDFPDIDKQHAAWTGFLHQNFSKEVIQIRPATNVGYRSTTLQPYPP